MALIVRKKFLQAPSGAAAPSAATHAWVPLTSTDASTGDPALVWSSDDQLILTLVPLT